MSSFASIFINSGARLMKLLVYDQKLNALRGGNLFGSLSKKVNPVRNITISPIKIGEMEAAWFTPELIKTPNILLYLHGGGYGACDYSTHKTLIGMISKNAGIKTLAINYRLAPQHPFPAALEDSVAAYQLLLKTVDSKHIAIGGDSAGGGLTFATLLKLKELGLPLPGRAFGLSPWLDLSCSGESMESRAAMDPLLNKESVLVWANRYLQGSDSQNPMASPLFGNLQGLPPILIHVGENEVLYDDAFRFSEKAKKAGVQVSFHSFKRMVHVFQFLGPFLPEAMESIHEISTFLKEEIKPSL